MIPHEPTAKLREQVELLAGLGLPQEQIARVIGVGRTTLRKHYRDELELGMARANAKVVESLFNLATKGPPAQRASCAIFWAKARLGWRTTEDPAAAPPRSQADEAQRHAAAEKLGKKEERQRAAEAVGGRFTPPAPPRRVN